MPRNNPRVSIRLWLEVFEERINPDSLPNGMPILNSLPSAPAAIFLDFDGDTSTGVTGYDRDNNYSSFNTSEQNDIVKYWSGVAQIFAPFNVNVTTLPPSPTVPKAWIVIGNDISGAGGPTTGGWSYINVFPNATPKSFVNSYSNEDLGILTAHELGHNFGLQHQSQYDSFGSLTEVYRTTSEPLRAPVMGGFISVVPQWSWGHSFNASVIQDDLSVIAAKLAVYGGDGYRPDDHGSSTSTATPTMVSGPTQFGVGVIERSNDIDVFSFISTGGRVSLTLAPDLRSGLDSVIEIRNSSDQVIAVLDTIANGQTLTMSLPVGTYYAVIKSKGKYGDIGGYKLTLEEGAPSGWQTSNIGLMAQTGSTSYSSATGTFTVRGSGADIWNTSDEFQYAWQYLSGNGSITAFVSSSDNTSPYAKAGVMIRESLAPNSRHASMFAGSYGQSPHGIARLSTSAFAVANYNGGPNPSVPLWVRITKNGSTITSQYSLNGSTWITVSIRTMTFPTGFYIGLATSAVNTALINSATYSNVSITGFTDPLATTNSLLGVPPDLQLSLPTTGTGVYVLHTTIPGATGYQFERSNDGVTFLPIYSYSNSLVGTNHVHSDTNLPGSQNWFYRYRAMNGLTIGPVSNFSRIVNRPSAVRNLELCSYSTTSVVLDWLDTDGENGFLIERSADGGGTWTTLTTLAANTPSYTATGLTIGTAYTFRVTPTSTFGDGVAATVTGSTQLPAMTRSLGTITSTSVQINWTDTTYETSYRIDRSTDGVTYTTLTTLPANSTTFTDSSLTPETEYHYRLVALNGASINSNAFTPLMVGTPPLAAVPIPWASADIGIAATTRGMTSLNGGTFKIISGGGQIWNASDSFRFTYQPLTGNGAITARILSGEATGSRSMFSLMMRETLTSGSRMAHILNLSTGTNYMDARTSTNGNSGGIGAISNGLPLWARLVRNGNTISGYTSVNGVTWTFFNSQTFTSLAGTLYVGIGVAADSTTQLATGTFSNVSVDRIDVQSVTVDDGTGQRSNVRSLTVAFNRLVNVSASSFTVTNAGLVTQAFAVDTSTSTATQTIAKLTFATKLNDGRYTLTVNAANVTDGSGMGLGVMSQNVTNAFHRLYGDANGNGTIAIDDLTAFGNAFNSASTAFDFEGNGTVDIADLTAFGNRFGVTI